MTRCCQHVQAFFMMVGTEVLRRQIVEIHSDRHRQSLARSGATTESVAHRDGMITGPQMTDGRHSITGDMRSGDAAWFASGA
jgi:hypothetical protein